MDVSDYSTSSYFSLEALSNSGIQNFFDGDFNKYNFKKKYDLVWISHVLEHQENIKLFLDKVVTLVNENEGAGYIAIAVPPRKPFIVSGHINLFNPGLLVYRLILSGVDCSKAKVFQYDSNICLLVKLKKTKLPPIHYDIGDIEKLTNLFPNSPNDGFNGDFMHVNLTSEELRIVYGI